MKLFFLGMVLLVATPLFGGNYAMDQGSFKVGGNADIGISYYANHASTTSLDGTFNPNICYFVQKRLCVGGSIIPSFYIDLNDSYRYISVKVKPEVRYYFGENEQKMYPFAGLIPNFGISNSRYSPSYTTYNIGFSVLGGVAYMVTKNVAIEPNVRVSYNREWGDSITATLIALVISVNIATFWF
jgi:opacity protein-like surface antigen